MKLQNQLQISMLFSWIVFRYKNKNVTKEIPLYIGW